MKVSFRIGGRPSAELASKTPEEALRNNLQLAKWELDNAYAGFEYATDPDLIDCYIYELNSVQMRYKAQCRHETLPLSPQSVEWT